MINNSTNTQINNSTNTQNFPGFNRTERRRYLGTKNQGHRNKAPRHIAARKPLPMPENWEGWRNWKPKKKAE